MWLFQLVAICVYFNELQVKFLGESAVNEGGTKRKFWRLMGLEIRQRGQANNVLGKLHKHD